MDLVSSLRPTSTDPQTIAAAIIRAEAAHAEAIERANNLERQMRAVLADASDAELDTREREAAVSHRAAERIGAILEQLRTMLAATAAPAFNRIQRFY